MASTLPLTPADQADIRLGLIGDAIGPSRLAALHLLAGVNETLPYKERVVGLVETHAPWVARIGAVKRVASSPEGRRLGVNPDYAGDIAAQGQSAASPVTSRRKGRASPMSGMSSSRA